MTNYYSKSWEFYRLHSENFKDDFDYYLNFTKGHQTLELFAGYGRLTNFLVANHVDMETVELEPNFAKFISIPAHKNHVCNVLDFKPTHHFERIIAGYNSFCLLRQEDDIKLFFSNLNQWLVKGGMASLSYYHPDVWTAQDGMVDQFKYEDSIITHTTRIDLSKRKDKEGIWCDEYAYDNEKMIYKYHTRIYENSDCLLPYLKDTNLKLKEVIIDYNNKNISDPGWVEFVLIKE